MKEVAGVGGGCPGDAGREPLRGDGEAGSKDTEGPPFAAGRAAARIRLPAFALGAEPHSLAGVDQKGLLQFSELSARARPHSELEGQEAKGVCATAGPGAARVSESHRVQKSVPAGTALNRNWKRQPRRRGNGARGHLGRPFPPGSCFCADSGVDLSWGPGRGRRAQGSGRSCRHGGVSPDALKGTHAIPEGGRRRRKLFSWRVGRVQRCFRIPRMFFHGGWFNKDHPC